MDVRIRPAVAGDIAPIARVFAAAFDADPVMAWAYPRAARRGERLAVLYGAILRHEALPFGATSVAVRGDEVAGAVIWRRRGRYGAPSWRDVPFALASARALDGNTGRMIALGRAVERLRPRRAHWYLQILGVAPGMQRTGVGTALVADGLRAIDAARMPAYLETTEENLPFYERLGFHPTGRTRVGDGPVEFALWREADQRGGA
jgi:GNAT superfamily N-acetyltransferase